MFSSYKTKTKTVKMFWEGDVWDAHVVVAVSVVKGYHTCWFFKI